ncbi:MAG TPA: DNA-binding response regulator, partial [Candidatus Limnocylindria bacterium]
MTPRVAVLIVDDQALVRTGLRMVLELEPDIDIVGEAADGEQAVTV